MDIQYRKIKAINVLQLLALTLVVALALGKIEPSLAQSSTPDKPVSQEVYREGQDISAGFMQNQSMSVEQSNSDKMIAKQQWKLYVNDSYRFNFRYPSSAKLDTVKPGKVTVLFIEPFKIGVDEGISEFGITFAVHENPMHLTAKEWALKEWEPDFIRRQESIKINGEKGFMVKVFGFDRDNYHIYLPKMGKIYEIDFVDPLSMPELSETLKKRYDVLFHSIVKTFQFR